MLYQQLSQHSDWQPESLEGKNQIPHSILPWLQEQGSLTAALIKLSNDNFKVIVKSEATINAYPHEQQKLNNKRDQTSLIREVELHVYDRAVVFARSVIPLALTNQQEGSLDNLGTKPLGHLLFKEGRPRSSKREFAHLYYNDEPIYARRTPYEYQGHHVLVSEFFLPSFLLFIE